MSKGSARDSRGWPCDEPRGARLSVAPKSVIFPASEHDCARLGFGFAKFGALAFFALVAKLVNK